MYGSGQTKLPCRLPGQFRGGEQEAPETVRDDKYFSDRQRRCPWCHESDPG